MPDQLRAAHEFPPLAGSVTIPSLISRSASATGSGRINGRDISFQTNVGTGQGESPVYPVIVGLTWDFTRPTARRRSSSWPTGVPGARVGDVGPTGGDADECHADPPRALAAGRAAVDRLAPFAEDGAVAVLAQTKAVSSYPTVPGAFYACVAALRSTGPRSRAPTASFTADGTRTIYALNVGTQVPPAGTRIIAHACGGRWTFRYDG